MEQAPERMERMELQEWVETVFAPMVQRRIDMRGQTWCAQWWKHPEVLYRLDALEQAWYELGPDGLGPSLWWMDHVDRHLAVLLDAETGPMSGCRPERHSDEPLGPLPCADPALVGR